MRFLQFIIVVALSVFQSSLFADSRIVIATADGVPLSNHEDTGFHDQIVQEAFKRIDVTLNIIHLTAERALVNANAGIEDGVYVRVQGIDNIYKNLVIVPEKITDYEFVAFSKNKNIKIDSWNSLKGYDIGIITGWKILEQNIPKSISLLKVKNSQQLFEVLNSNKVEIVIYNKIDGFGSIKELGLKGIHALDSPLATKEMFLYLHKDKASLIPQLSEALKAIKADGTYNKIRKITLTPYLPE